MKNGSDGGSGAPPRKLRFAPKIPVRKPPKPANAETESSVSKDDVVDKELLAKLNVSKSQDDFSRRLKAGKNVVRDQVTFGYGSTSTPARSFGTSKEETINDSASAYQPKEYVEPWDYVRCHYPVSLPWRRPYSGDPEVLDKLEFGEGGSAHLPIDESKINTAQNLGLMDTSNEPKMIFLQFPPRLPSVKLPDVGKGPGNKAADASSKTACKLKDFPPGFMGKMMVYRSGEVKMKLGDVLFDVSPGTHRQFSEEVVAVNAKERRYCVLGDLNKHAVVTPDIDSLLDDLNNSDD